MHRAIVQKRRAIILAHHLGAVIDAVGDDVSSTQGAEVGHRRARVEECVADTIDGIRMADYLAAGVDAVGRAVSSTQGAQVSHHRARIDERVAGRIAGRERFTAHLPAGVDGVGAAVSSTQGAQVGDCVRCRAEATLHMRLAANRLAPAAISAARFNAFILRSPEVLNVPPRDGRQTGYASLLDDPDIQRNRPPRQLRKGSFTLFDVTTSAQFVNL